MVLTSRPFSLSVSSSNFFAASGTFMTWSCTKSHFFGGTFHSQPHFCGRSFHAQLHFYGRTYSNPKMHKHEENTKKRRRKHERNTKFCVFFVRWRRKSSGKNSPLIGVKNQWANLDHWNQRVKMTRWNQRLKVSLWCGWFSTRPKALFEPLISKCHFDPLLFSGPI